MWKLMSSKRHTAIIVSMAVAAMTGSAASVAGPGCMGGPQQQMYRGYYPAGPAMPQSAYRPGPPPVYRAAMNPYTRNMAPRYPGYLPAQWRTPAAAAPRTAELASAEVTPVNSGGQRDNGDNTSATDNITVRINGMRFEPSNLTVKPGTTVTWVQDSNMPHTVTGQADELRSGTLNGGQQFSHTFDATGRFDYGCDFHPSMKGSVIVEGMDT